MVEVIMSVKHEDTPDSNATEHKESPAPILLPRTTKEAVEANSPPVAGSRQPTWRWLLDHSFSPSWLPQHLRHPSVGYIVAILLQCIAVFLTGQLIQVYPLFAFSGLLEILAIALVAFNWGAGPSLAATFFGAILLDYIVLRQPLIWSLVDMSIEAVHYFIIFGYL